MKWVVPVISGLCVGIGLFSAGYFAVQTIGNIPPPPTPQPTATPAPTATPINLPLFVRTEVDRAATETVQKAQQLATNYTDQQLAKTRQTDRAEIEKRVEARVIEWLTPEPTPKFAIYLPGTEDSHE